MSDWMPNVGDWVVYRPAHGPAEDGEVVAIRPGDGVVIVRYRGDLHGKTTYVRDLEPGAAS